MKTSLRHMCGARYRKRRERSFFAKMKRREFDKAVFRSGRNYTWGVMLMRIRRSSRYPEFRMGSDSAVVRREVV